MAALGLCCFAQAVSSCRGGGGLLCVVRGLLIAVASLVAEHGLWALRLHGSWALGHRLNSCGTQAWLLLGMWNLPTSETEPVSPALAGRLLTTGSPKKSLFFSFFAVILVSCIRNYYLSQGHKNSHL